MGRSGASAATLSNSTAAAAEWALDSAAAELGLLRGDLVEDLFLVELGEDFALADGVR